MITFIVLPEHGGQDHEDSRNLQNMVGETTSLSLTLSLRKLNQNNFKIRSLYINGFIVASSTPIYQRITSIPLPSRSFSPKYVYFQKMSMEVAEMTADIMVDILKRLPVKYVLRFRCVCKFWNSLTQEPHFIRQHMESWRNPPTLGIIALSWAPEKDHLSLHYIFSNYMSSNGWQRFELADLARAPSVCMSNSCNGLVCLYSPGYVYVVNPSIREVFLLPRGEGSAFALALGHDESTDEYKVVRLFTREESDGTMTMECQVFTLGSRSSWRAIEDPPLHVLHFSSPVIVNGAIYWGLKHGTENGIALSFDIKDERFKIIMPPKAMSEFHHKEVTEMGGRLCLSAFNPAEPFRRVIWILRDYERCRWVRESFYLCYVPRDEASKAIPIAEHKGKVVWSNRLGRLDCYDRKTGRFLKPIYVNGTITVPFMESLVSPIKIHEKVRSRVQNVHR